MRDQTGPMGVKPMTADGQPADFATLAAALEAIVDALDVIGARLAALEAAIPRGDPRDGAPDLAPGWAHAAAPHDGPAPSVAEKPARARK